MQLALGLTIIMKIVDEGEIVQSLLPGPSSGWF